MAKRKLSQREYEKKHAARQMTVAKRDDMMQKARFALTVQEYRCVLYAISCVKPDDSFFGEYTFELKDFYAICGLQKESYTELKAILKGLRDKSWWVTIDDKGTESAVSWFSVARTNKGSGKVTIKFHEDMAPFLLELSKQAREQQLFYTQYDLQYVLPMSSQFSPRLYELLKSYQKNNREWCFNIDILKRHMNCENYKNFNDFRRWALDPAIAEINEYTDINIAMDVVKEGRGGRVAMVIFYMAQKSPEALQETQVHVNEVLDGQVSFDELQEELRKSESSVKEKFFRENTPYRRKGI